MWAFLSYIILIINLRNIDNIDYFVLIDIKLLPGHLSKVPNSGPPSSNQPNNSIITFIVVVNIYYFIKEIDNKHSFINKNVRLTQYC